MAAWNGPQTAIILRAIVQSPPETKHTLGLSVKERAVLMSPHFSADVRLFKNVHGLDNERLLLA